MNKTFLLVHRVRETETLLALYVIIVEPMVARRNLAPVEAAKEAEKVDAEEERGDLFGGEEGIASLSEGDLRGVRDIRFGLFV